MRIIGAALVAIALVVSACGSSSETNGTDTTGIVTTATAPDDRTIRGDHLPEEVRTLAPDPDVLDAMSYNLCGSGFGSYSASRRYCHVSGQQSFSMAVGMSHAQMAAIDPTLSFESDPIPEGVEWLRLTDGSSAAFTHDSFYPEIEGVGPVTTEDRKHVLRLNWKRLSGVAVAITTSFTEGDASGVPALELDDLLRIANSIDSPTPVTPDLVRGGDL